MIAIFVVFTNFIAADIIIGDYFCGAEVFSAFSVVLSSCCVCYFEVGWFRSCVYAMPAVYWVFMYLYFC